MADYIYGSDNNGGSDVNGSGNGNGSENENERRSAEPTEGEREQSGNGSEQQQRGVNNNGFNNGYGYGGGYGYNYQYNSPYQQTPPTPPTPPKKRGRHTVLVVVSIILATVLLATAAAVGGYFVSRAGMGDGDPAVDGSDSTGKAEETTQRQPAGVVLAPESLGTKDKGTIADVVTKVADSVVEVTTEYAQQNGLYYTYGAGSGVIINAKDGKGYIITNNHVITGDSGTATTINVRLTNGETYKASIVGADADSDIAVLSIEAENLSTAPIGTSSKLVVGEEVVVIGNPLGTLGGSVTNGIISALDREITVENETMNLMQTNAAVNPGNSGGGMFNMAGELVGIVNAKYSETGVEGLGFAIPIDDAVFVANELLDHGYVRGRISLHISVLEVQTVEDLIRYRVNAMGLYIVEAEEGYNDDVLKNGDRLAQVDGIEVLNVADLKAILKGHNIGDKLSAYIVRGGNYIEVELECFEKTTGDVQFDNNGVEDE